MEIMDFDEDDWFFRSVTDYDELFMYELQGRANVLTWINEFTVCMSCSSQNNGGKRNELLMLKLPQKLTALDKGVSKDRDFKMVGGCSHEMDLEGLKHVPESRLVLSSEAGENCVRTWSLPQDSDLIEEGQKFENPFPNSEPAVIALTDSKTNQFAFGSHSSNISIQDIEKGITTSHSNQSCDVEERLCGIYWQEASVLKACSRETGRFWQWDLRTDQTLQASGKLEGVGPWTSDTCEGNGQIYLCDSEGNVLITDTTGEVTTVMSTDVKTPGHNLNIKCSPTENAVFSLAGSDGCVRIFDTTSKEPTKAVFCHEGHMINDRNGKVKGQLWHPRIPRLLLSSATDGSLHAWKYVKR